MPANYLHGIETIEITRGARPVQVIKSAVIALIGIAPVSTGPEKLTLVLNERDAAAFGIPALENTIGSALKAIFAQGPATVMVVNVFDPANHAVAVDFNYVVTNGKFKISDRLLVDGLVVETTGVSPVTLSLNTDYVYDATTQTVTILNGASYPDNTVLKASFNALTDDLSDVTDAEVIGIDQAIPTDSTGLKRFKAAFNELGFNPRVIIAPWFSSRPAVAVEMETLASSALVRGHAILDPVKSATLSHVLTGRGSTAGVVKNFQTSNPRTILTFPYVKDFDVFYNQEGESPLSAYLAGVIANTDYTRGYWKSPSSEKIKGILGLSKVVTFRANDAQTDANILNEQGIVTVSSGYARGYAVFGNRSAAWPGSTLPENFISIRRTADVIHESLEQAFLQFLDEPITPAVIDAIRETGNGFMRRLIAQGALVGGEVKYIAANNDPTQIANGQLVFDLEFMPPPPLERITLRSFINIDLLSALNADASN